MSVQRNIVVLHFAGHVIPGRKGDFAQQIRFAVHAMVKHAEPVIGKTYLVEIGEYERKARCQCAAILDHTVGFAAHITGRVLYSR